ncbi:MAG: hydantoinase/oxoprolinase family protein [Dehalococcoidia bacterium]|nr:hydantoinase/oxoprolinase family protein [Dehalococcoidia bacterium]MCB9484528.1 hydantoinase/oxoprolinase family protein [Thermoflexaceae bacterium]
MPQLIGVDVGGTFTDFLSFGPDGVRAWKRLSTPLSPEIAVLAGLDGVRPERLVHASTVATNALLERRGPRTVLITTEGFRDVLEIRRQTRSELYDLEPTRRPHVVARGDTIPVHERMDAAGLPVIELEEREIAGVVQQALAIGAETFALSLLFSFRNPAHERRLAAALRAAGLDVSVSHEVRPEYREYERASTTAVNAFLRPVVRRYLGNLAASHPGVRIMQSSGGLASSALTSERPVTMVLSGPAAGVLGAIAVSAAAGYNDIITFDMGGTSTDVALCTGGVPQYRSATDIDGLAVHTPVVDVVTVGAGGGSIASIDRGGALEVGPQSAGADPGPACYGRGGPATVTDANLALGRLGTAPKLAGTMALDVTQARAALGELGDPAEMASAIVEVVNANMARALRAVSLERGFDPAQFTLVAFGGAGPLHACELAEEVGIPCVLVPGLPGVLSALGMVTAPESVERSAGILMRLDAGDAAARLRAAAEDLRQRTIDELRSEAVPVERVLWAADARYAGQAHEIRVNLEQPEAEAIAAAFHEAHERSFGFSAPDRVVEIVALRARAVGPLPPSPLRPLDSPPRPPARGEAADSPVTVIERVDLGPGSVMKGPAVVTQDDATTWVPARWAGHVDAYGNLILEPSP